jgi:hypothetical protein
VYVLVVTATPVEDSTQNAPPSLQATSTLLPTLETAASPTPEATATTNPIPTPTIGQIQVAEQVFENGRMFWIQPRNQIWVLTQTAPGRGIWTIYPDTFTEGEPESDPNIIAPSGRYQPERGFGKLWRTNNEVREKLGWGTTPEFGYVSGYEYHPGGTIDRLRPGYHILYSLYQEKFQFNETDGTWQQVS